jgi:hypothetical protein
VTVAAVLGQSDHVKDCCAPLHGILLKRDRAHPAPPEEAFLTSIAIAQQQ